MRKEFRFALRVLSRSPMVTAAAVVSVALGIGANTSIFSLFYQVLMRPLPVRHPEQLVVFHQDYRAPGFAFSDNNQTVFSYPLFRDIRDRATMFDGVIARSGARVNVIYGGRTENVGANLVSGNFFEVLGVRAVLGRVLTPDDEGPPGANPVAVLSYAAWQSRFGGSRTVLNQKLVVNNHPMVIVGVLEPGFHGVLAGAMPELFVPVSMKAQMTPVWDGLLDRRTRWLNVFARLKPGMTLSQAEAGLHTIYHPIMVEELAQLGRLRSERERQLFLAQRVRLEDASRGISEMARELKTPLIALMAMVGLVLLIACANVAGLMTARAAARQKDIAIRMAIGATRWAIVRQSLAEGAVVAFAGGLLGFAAARWTTAALVFLMTGGPADGWFRPELDFRLLGFTVGLSVLAGLLFGLIPALQTAGPELSQVLRGTSGTVTGVLGQARFRKALVVTQIALSLLLVVSAGLFSRSLYNLLHADLGFRIENLIWFVVDPSLAGYSDARGIALCRDLRDRLAGLPSVRAAAAANPGPLSRTERGGTVVVEGYHPAEDEEPGASYFSISPDYFRTLGIPLLAGREFTERDDASAPKVAIINQAFARRYFGNRNPIGYHASRGSAGVRQADCRIVGVAADAKHANAREAARPILYYPFAQERRLERVNFYVRTEGDVSQAGPLIRQAVQQLDAGLPVLEMKSMQVLVEETVHTDRMIAVLSTAFGVLATLLAAVGLYGIVAYTVARRTSEIGVRIALGASRRRVLGLVLREAAGLVAAGLAIGIPAALALSRLVQSQLFGIKAADPLTFVAGGTVLTLVALLAGYLPGRRASRIDPIRALRQE
ncbi:MAG: ABC transporter permease [Rhodospirillales bacterium]